MLEKLPKNVGFGLGLEFRESSCLLNAKNSTLVKEGMVFNVSVGKIPLSLFAQLFCHILASVQTTFHQVNCMSLTAIFLYKLIPVLLTAR